MTKQRFTAGLVVALLFQFGILTQTIASRIALLENGAELTLQTVPVDPRDFFRGDFVILRYKVSQLRSDTVRMPETLESTMTNQTAWVVFENSEGSWRPAELIVEEEALPPKGERQSDTSRTLKATIAYVNVYRKERPLRSAEACPSYPCTEVSLDYGIEKYFVPEGTGRALEEATDEEVLSIILALGDDGTAAIKGIELKGERLYEEPLL